MTVRLKATRTSGVYTSTMPSEERRAAIGRRMAQELLSRTVDPEIRRLTKAYLKKRKVSPPSTADKP